MVVQWALPSAVQRVVQLVPPSVDSLVLQLGFTVVVEGFLSELPNCGRISCLQVSVALEKNLQNTFFESLKKIKSYKKLTKTIYRKWNY